MARLVLTHHTSYTHYNTDRDLGLSQTQNNTSDMNMYHLKISYRSELPVQRYLQIIVKIHISLNHYQEFYVKKNKSNQRTNLDINTEYKKKFNTFTPLPFIIDNYCKGIT